VRFGFTDKIEKPTPHFFSQKAVHIFKTLFPGGHPNLEIMEKNLAIIEKRMKLGN